MSEQIARICETELTDYFTGSNFKFSFDVDDGPVRTILIDILIKRRIRLKPTSDGKGVMMYSDCDEVKE